MKPYLIILKEFWQRHPKIFLSNIFLNIISGLLEGFALLTMAPLLDFFFNNAPEKYSRPTQILIQLLNSLGITPTLQTFFISLITLVLAKAIFLVFCRYHGLKTKFAVLQDFLINLLKGIFHSNPNFFSKNKQGEIINLCIRELGKTGDTFGSMILLCSNFIRCLVYLGAVIYFSQGIIFYTIALVIIGHLPFKFIGKMSYRLGKNDGIFSGQYTVALQEALSGAKLILGLGKSKQTIENVNAKYQHVKNNAIRTGVLGELITQAQEPISLILIFALVYIATTRLGRGSGEVLVMLYSFRMALSSISAFLNTKNQFDQNYSGYEAIKSIIQQASLEEQKNGTVIFEKLHDHIEFKNYSFSYGETETLKSINLKLNRGQKIALVGQSGSGKSTLSDAVLGLCSPKLGEILVDGKNLFSYQMKSWREQIGYVPQRPFLFNASIRENLLWGSPEASEADMWWALQLAEAASFAREMPKGLDSNVGDFGANLSGGQQQRITLARAFLRKSEIYILDEATSALDPQTEQLIIGNIRRELKDKTLIFVSHRLSTISGVDTVYFLKDGEIVESGTYQQLISNQKNFYQMSVSQNSL